MAAPDSSFAFLISLSMSIFCFLKRRIYKKSTAVCLAIGAEKVGGNHFGSCLNFEHLEILFILHEK